MTFEYLYLQLCRTTVGHTPHGPSVAPVVAYFVSLACEEQSEITPQMVPGTTIGRPQAVVASVLQMLAAAVPPGVWVYIGSGLLQLVGTFSRAPAISKQQIEHDQKQQYLACKCSDCAAANRQAVWVLSRCSAAKQALFTRLRTSAFVASSHVHKF